MIQCKESYVFIFRRALLLLVIVFRYMIVSDDHNLPNLLISWIGDGSSEIEDWKLRTEDLTTSRRFLLHEVLY